MTNTEAKSADAKPNSIIKKPKLEPDYDAAIDFSHSDDSGKARPDPIKPKKVVQMGIQRASRNKSMTPVPIEGDVKLSCNITAVLHHKLKIYSADTRISIRDILEHLIENLKDAKV